MFDRLFFFPSSRVPPRVWYLRACASSLVDTREFRAGLATERSHMNDSYDFRKLRHYQHSRLKLLRERKRKT